MVLWLKGYNRMAVVGMIELDEVC